MNRNKSPFLHLLLVVLVVYIPDLKYIFWSSVKLSGFVIAQLAKDGHIKLHCRHCRLIVCFKNGVELACDCCGSFIPKPRHTAREAALT